MKFGTGKSNQEHTFSQVPKADIPRSQFNRSHGFKTTFDSGYLVPIYVDEALPGDTFNLSVSTFARLSTPIVPVMDNMYVDTFFFAVPIRLIWDNWKKFNGEQINPGDSTSFTVPVMTANSAAIGSLSDYFGIPTGVSLSYASLWHRAYNLIYNEWFRDQNLQNSVVVDKDNGPDDVADYVLLRRGKRHDYFTSSLPWPQKGTAVTVPIGTSATVKINAVDTGGVVFKHDGTAPAGGNLMYSGGYFTDSAGVAAKYDPNGTLYADLSSATAATINQLRTAFQIQKLYERDARGGTRYTEIIRSHFGVVSPDARLQRPEFLGGSSNPLTINPVVQTSGTPASGTPQGNLAAYGIHSSTGKGFVKSFTEHCVLIGLINVRADLNYQQGLNRMFSRSTRFDFYWPALSHLGEQAILNKEIYADASGNDTLVFGYQERYAEYRYKPSVITGKFRSTASGTLDIWHLAQKYSSLPVLDATFIVENPPVSRIVAVNTEPQFLLDAYFTIKTARPMPTYSVPGLIDHF